MVLGRCFEDAIAFGVLVGKRALNRLRISSTSVIMPRRRVDPSSPELGGRPRVVGHRAAQDDVWRLHDIRVAAAGQAAHLPVSGAPV